MFCVAAAADYQSNDTSISVNGTKEMVMEYGLDKNNLDEDSIEEEFDGEDEEQEEEERQAAFVKRVSDAFEMPLPDVRKSLIGPDVISFWKFYICRTYPSLPYRLIKYALANSPRLQLLEYNTRTGFKIILSPSCKIQRDRQLDKSNPTGTSQEYLK